MAASISFGQAPLNVPEDKKVTEQYNLGVRYQLGEGVPKDLGKAAELYKKAADQGNQRAIINLKSLSGDRN